MSGIICCACSILAISVLQFVLIQWRNELNKDQEKNVSQPNRDLWWILLPGRRRSCRLQLQWGPVKKLYGSSDPWKSVAWEDRPGQPGKETVLLESSSSTDYSKLDYDRVWSSEEWKAEATTHDRSGEPDQTSWRMVQVRPDHVEILRRNRAIRKVRRTTLR